jgi:hypothetical protein
MSSEDLERLAHEGYEEDVRADVRALLDDFPACALHNLSINFNRLPVFFQAAWIAHADDPEIGFRIDYVEGEGGNLVPQVTLVRIPSDTPGAPRIHLTGGGASGDLDLSEFSVAAGAGILMRTTTASSPEASPTPFVGRSPSGAGNGAGNGSGPNSLLASNPYLGTAVTIGGSALIYMGVDWTVERLNVPENLRGIVGTGGTFGIYEGLGRLGVIERPDWGLVGRTLPHLVLLNVGASHLFETFGLPRGGRANNAAGFLTTTTAYVAAPRLAARFPALANVYRASIGLPAAEVTAVASFRGAGLLAGGLRYVAGPVGMVFAIDAAAGMLGDVGVWAMDGFGDPDLNTALWRAAKESFYADFANNAGGFIGWSARNLSVINKAAFGWASVFSSGFEGELDNAVEDVIRRWVRGTNEFGTAMDNTLLLAALQAVERPEGSDEFRINWGSYRTLLGSYGSNHGDALRAGYAAERLIRPTERGVDISEASATLGLVSYEGGLSIRDQDGLESHLEDLLADAEGDGRLRSMLTDLIRSERNAYRDRLSALNLLEGQPGRPRTSAEMTDEQRAFLHGDGHTSEAATRRHRIEALNGLLRRLDARSAAPSAPLIGNTVALSLLPFPVAFLPRPSEPLLEVEAP